jgi:hypothetical protein
MVIDPAGRQAQQRASAISGLDTDPAATARDSRIVADREASIRLPLAAEGHHLDAVGSQMGSTSGPWMAGFGVSLPNVLRTPMATQRSMLASTDPQGALSGSGHDAQFGSRRDSAIDTAVRTIQGSVSVRATAGERHDARLAPKGVAQPWGAASI